MELSLILILDLERLVVEFLVIIHQEATVCLLSRYCTVIAQDRNIYSNIWALPLKVLVH